MEKKVFVFVMASFNQECYKSMIALRIHQFQNRGIAFHFLFNGPVPAGLPIPPETYTVVPELGIEKYGEGHETCWVPHVFQQFLQTFFRNPANAQFDYILRLNVSTFVNFDRLFWLLPFLPKERLFAGPYGVHKERVFCNGTAMLFSKDVALAFALDTPLDPALVAAENDDVIISWSLTNRYFPYDLMTFFRWVEEYSEPSQLGHFFAQHKRHTVFFRIKSAQNREVMDPQIWALLYQVFG